MGDDGRRARKVPGWSQRNLAGDLKAVEEPGSSVIWDGAAVFKQTLTTTPRCCHGICVPNPHDKFVPRSSCRSNSHASSNAVAVDELVFQRGGDMRNHQERKR